MAEKNNRTQRLKNFTRSVNAFNVLHQSDPLIDQLTLAFEKVSTRWDELEAAQDSLIETIVDEKVAEAEMCYLDEPETRYHKVLLEYNAYKKKSIEDESRARDLHATNAALAEDERRVKAVENARDIEAARIQTEKKLQFESAEEEFKLEVNVFAGTDSGIQDLMKDASVEDKRRSFEKLENQFHSIHKKLVLGSIDPAKDINDYRVLFEEKVEKPFTITQKWFLAELKNSVPISSPITPAVLSSTSSKNERVTLPTFSGDETSSPSPFLVYPIWRKKWDSLIAEYKESHRPNVLWEKLDDTARDVYAGQESDYNESMKRLDSYYANPYKVINCIMSEVDSPDEIAEGDYQGLISYCTILERNYNRLQSMNPPLGHEMSNSSTMSTVLCKLPISIAVKWAEHIETLEDSIKSQPFPSFIAWLLSQKAVWERVVAVEVRRSGASAVTHYTGGVNRDPPKPEMKCFSCGKVGHKQRSCPNKNNNNNNNNNSNNNNSNNNNTNRSNDNKKKRKRPKVRKYWCAFHKDDASKRCNSANCQELRQVEKTQRIQLLKDNGDCSFCCGDHKPDDCNNKTRVCGGGKQDRGCTQSHFLHELFCPAARVFSIQQVHMQNDRPNNVVLLIMDVPGPRKGVSCKVFFDLGSTSHFVREAFAKLMKFKGVRVRLCVTTLAGVVTEYVVTKYTCSMRDKNNQLFHFSAYGLESVTGTLGGLDSRLIKRWFPNLADVDVEYLKRTSSNVDYLIGAQKPSWHPVRTERAEHGGDLWLFEGQFGMCLSGSHPDIRETSEKRSVHYFDVNFELETLADKPELPSSHTLEYCPERVKSYVHKSGFCESSHLGQPVCNPSAVFHQHVQEAEFLPGPSSFKTPSIESTVVCSHENVSNTESNLEMLTSTVDPVAMETTSEVVSDIVHLPEIVVDSTVAVAGFENARCLATKTSVITAEEQFYKSEALGTVVEPQCGSCKCTKCPLPGSKYSYSEQKQFDLIQQNLKYNEEERRYYTVYPWKCPRSTLPKNDKIAHQSLLSLEHRLSKDPELAEDFCNQITDMLKRGAAIVLSDEEVHSWKGDYYFLPLVGVKGKKKWLRLCFDAARRQGGCPSMNECIHKGPDRFLNNLLAVLLGFRNGRVGCVADISKFHNQVYLETADIHMQRFLWRNMDTSVAPAVYAVRVNNFGVVAANCIATSALHKSADEFKTIYPEESAEIKTQTYVDDELTAAEDKSHALVKTSRMDEITNHAGMPNKGWTFTGDDKGVVSISGEDMVEEERVLGSVWDPKLDDFVFHVTLRFQHKRSPVVEVSSIEELLQLPLFLITRRSLLSNIHRIFDPMGLLIPVLLQAKLLLRATLAEKGLGWDDPVPQHLLSQWMSFLESLLSLGDVAFPRSLWPKEKVIGDPILVIFSDGSQNAYGAVAYIRWKLPTGGYWTRLIMAKGKICQKDLVSIPRIELNGTVIGVRIKKLSAQRHKP